MPGTNVRTTIAVRGVLLSAVDDAVRRGVAKSRNAFVALAIENQLAVSRRQAIDAAFAEMASDPIYQKEAVQVTDEFREADWEAFGRAESDV